MQQIVDLEKDATFQSTNVALVSVSTDPLSVLQSSAQEWGVTTPILSDADKKVVNAYDVMKWATAGGEPSHTFILVGQDGKVKWIQDYGHSSNRGVMYVEVDELNREIGQRLP